MALHRGLNVMQCLFCVTQRRFFQVRKNFNKSESRYCRSHWPSGLRRGSAADRFLGLRFRILPRTWMSISCVLSGINTENEAAEALVGLFLREGGNRHAYVFHFPLTSSLLFLYTLCPYRPLRGHANYDFISPSIDFISYVVIRINMILRDSTILLRLVLLPDELSFCHIYFNAYSIFYVCCCRRFDKVSADECLGFDFRSDICRSLTKISGHIRSLCS